MMKTNFYQQASSQIIQTQQRLTEIEHKLQIAYARWEALEQKK